MATALPAVAGATPRGERIAGWAADPAPAERTDKAKRGLPSPSNAKNALAVKDSRPSTSGKGCTSPRVQGSRRSAFESCLKKSARPKAEVPAQTVNIDVVTESLRRDKERQSYKYTFRDPAASSARYHRGLPDRGVNEKYCRPEVREPQPDSPPVRFCITTLSKWFQAIDRDDSGTLNPKEIILALRSSEELRHLFVSVQDMSGFADPLALEALGDGMDRLHHGEGEGPELDGRPGSLTTSLFEARASADGTLEDVRTLMHSRAGSECGSHCDFADLTHDVEQVSPEELKERKAELIRLKTILKEIDTDQDGCLGFDEFVEFFRRAGLLLEYKTFVGQIMTTTRLPEILNAQLPPTPSHECLDGVHMPCFIRAYSLASQAEEAIHEDFVADFEDTEDATRTWTPIDPPTVRSASHPCHPSTPQWPASTTSSTTRASMRLGTFPSTPTTPGNRNRVDVWMEHGASLAKAVERQRSGTLSRQSSGFSRQSSYQK